MSLHVFLFLLVVSLLSLALLWRLGWLRLQPSNKQKARVLADVRRYDEALAAYDQAMQLDPYDVFLCKDKAELLV
jgi:tetratricopeptide (TPR) repeat protein